MNKPLAGMSRAVGAVSLIAGLIAIFSFLTGRFTMRQVGDMIRDLSRNTDSRASVSVTNSIDQAARARVEHALVQYSEAFNLVVTGKMSVEQLLERARRVSHVLLIDGLPGPSVLDRLSDVEIQQLGERLPGVRVWRHETQGVEIDPAFFVSLSRTNGRPADVDFFEAYRQTYPAGFGWPAYIRQQTDYSGCIDYKSGKLTDLYFLWSAFSTNHPAAYPDEVLDIVEALSGHLSKSTCACEDMDSVVHELTRFADEFSHTFLGRTVRGRVEAIAAGTEDMRFYCLSG